MKLLIYASIIIVMSCFFGCSHVSNPVVGTWEMVYPTSENANSTSKQSKTIKILSDTHFAFGVLQENGEVFSGGGRYIFSDSTYIEIIEYHSLPFLIGRELKFRCTLKDDKWYHSGSYIIEGRRFNINEVWQRVIGSKHKKRIYNSRYKRIAFGRNDERQRDAQSR